MDIAKIAYILRNICLVNPKSALLVGVSGGPDSISLFHILSRLGYSILPAHFDHQLRDSSSQEADILESSLRQKGYGLIRGDDDVRKFASDHCLSIEEAARMLRYRFLFEQARKYEAQAVVTAHTADDQVETVLMHILRGSGLTGLKGISYRQSPNAWDESIPLIRPMLDIWRNEILDYCNENELSPIIDETNLDIQYLRNRIRNRLIPELEQNYNPQIKKSILRLSKTLYDDEEIVDKSVDDAWKNCCKEDGDGYFRFQLDYLKSQSIGIQRHIFRKALKLLVKNEEEIGFEVIQRGIDTLSRNSFRREIELNEGILVTFAENDVLLYQKKNKKWLDRYPQIGNTGILEVSKSVKVGTKWKIQAISMDICPSINDIKSSADPFQVWIDEAKLSSPLMIRSMLPGERFEPYGMDGKTIKLSNYFTNAKLPRQVRAKYPIVVCGDQIVWIPGYRLGHPFRITRNTKSCILLQLIRY